jgi:hypothetical protein
VVAIAPVAVAIARADATSRSAGRAELPRPREKVERTVLAAPAPANVEPADCPSEMVLVEGDWCPRVEQRCLRWMDPPGRFHRYRCAEYAQPARCLAPRVHERFCIDRRERAETSTALPLNGQSWTDAKRACDAAGARVCMDSEWTFACEGEEMRPYPYGWRRAADRCNADRYDLLVAGRPWLLRDERTPTGAHPDCTSPFGLVDMAGNVAEWVSVDGTTEGSVVVQKGNWWQPGKHACRDEQAGHDRFYKGTETGFRCCAGARALLTAPAPPDHASASSRHR